MYTYLLDIEGTVRTDMVSRDFDKSSVPTNEPENLDSAAYMAWLREGNTPTDPEKIPLPIPTPVSLSDWRSGLDLWMRDKGDGTKVSRLTDVYAAVKPIVDSGSPLGKVAMQQLEYSNFVHLDRLKQLRSAFAFTDAECEESMWRANLVANGDINGKWPPEAK